MAARLHHFKSLYLCLAITVGALMLKGGILIKEHVTTVMIDTLVQPRDDPVVQLDIHNDTSLQNNSETAPSQMKLILYWKTNLSSSTFEKCEWQNCEISEDKSRVGEASFVVFGDGLGVEPSYDWPSERFPNQSYVYFAAERAISLQRWMLRYNGKFNLTMTYRVDSDISVYVRANLRSSEPTEGPYILREPLINRSKSVVWTVSHCRAESGRDEYARELAKYIDVDIYGRCGNRECRNNTCRDLFMRSYKFHLAFENMVCQDYITEKLGNAFRRELIPIVFGGGDYKAVAPPNSYIDVRDYKSPADLARYLHYLASNETAFNEYFQWNIKYTYDDFPKQHCYLCKAAHDPGMARPAHEDIFSWWMNSCDNGLMNRMRKAGNW